MPDICIFGDSIAYGFSDLEKGGWVNRLRLYVENEHPEWACQVYNQGVSGDDTNDLLNRFKTEAEAREPEIIIFAIGINDSMYIEKQQNSRVALEQFKENLKELLTQAKKIAKTAVMRNTIRRRSYSALEEKLLSLKNGYYLRFYAKASAGRADFASYSRDFDEVLKKAGLLNEN